MMKTLSAELARTTSSLNNLTASVKAKSNVTLNAEKVAEVMSRRVTEHFDQAVDVPVQGLRSDLESLRSEMGALGNEKLAEVEKSVEGSLKYLNDACRNIEDIERRVTFVGIGRLTSRPCPSSPPCSSWATSCGAWERCSASVQCSPGRGLRSRLRRSGGTKS